MAILPMTLSEAEGDFFAVLILCIILNSGDITCFDYSVFAHKLKRWCGYVSRLRCRFACGSADATATHFLLLQ